MARLEHDGGETADHADDPLDARVRTIIVRINLDSIDTPYAVDLGTLSPSIAQEAFAAIQEALAECPPPIVHVIHNGALIETTPLEDS